MAEFARLPQPLPAWVDVLDRIEQGLRQSLEQAVEPAALAELAELAKQVEAGESAALGSLDNHMANWRTRLDLVAVQTEDAGTLAAREEAALAALVQSMRGAREKLVRWTKPAA